MASCVMLPVLILLFVGFSKTASQGETYVSPSNKHCFSCPAGTKVYEHCEEDLTNSTCVQCDEHTFSSVTNSQKHCNMCKSSCPKNSKTVTECTAVSNRECQCDSGHHRYPLDAIDVDDWKCISHSRCDDGEGEEYYGNHTHNTKCRPCQKGVEFVNRVDPDHPVCQACSRCADHQVEREACTLHSDTQCVLANKVTGSTVSAAPTRDDLSVTTAAGPADVTSSDDQSLSGGAIFGITYGVLVLTGILVTVLFLFYCWRRDRELLGQLNIWWKVAWIVGIIIGMGVIVVLVICMRKVCKRQEPQPADPATPPRQNEGEPFLGNGPHSSPTAGQDASGDIEMGNIAVPSGSCVPDPSTELTNEHPLGSTESQENAPANGNCPVSEWSLEFIVRQVFPRLCDMLGSEWHAFVQTLPGWPSNIAKALKERKFEENATTEARIHACLTEWRKRCPAYVTRENILKTLVGPGVGRVDLKQELALVNEDSVF